MSRRMSAPCGSSSCSRRDEVGGADHGAALRQRAELLAWMGVGGEHAGDAHVEDLEQRPAIRPRSDRKPG